MSDVATLRFADIAVGDGAEFDVELTQDLVDRFAELSGDFSPLHTDEEFAKTTPLGGRVAHGFLGGIFFSRLIGMHLPGQNALYLSQQLFFRAPMHIGTHVTVSGKVIQCVSSVRVIKIFMQVTNRDTGETLIDGEAMVKLLV
jgi:acyl dehydratase